MQREVCVRLHAKHFATPSHLKVGISRDVREGKLPINGLRHLPVGDTTGWYLWAGGEPSADPDYFLPLHVSHVASWCSAVLPYLGLPPGWRFLLAPGHEDVWFDESLLVT